MRLELFVALRYLRARRKQTFISLITFLSMAGVALGVCALVVVLSVMGGFERELRTRILGLNSHLALLVAGSSVQQPQRVLKMVQSDPQVTAATPFVEGQAMLVTRGAASGAIVRGLKLPEGLKVLEVEGLIKRGRLTDLGKTDPPIPGLVLGVDLARRLGLDVGSILTVISPLGQETPLGRAPKSEPFKVVALFESGMYQFDAAICFMSYAKSQDFFEMGSAATGIEAKVADIYQARKVGLRLARRLGPLFYSYDWITRNAPLFAALKLERLTMFIILILIVLVAAFGIISSLIMMVMEKTRDIAILKAMGAGDGLISRIFMLQGLIIGAAGTLLGLVSGLGLCWLLARYKFITLPKNVYPLSTLPVQVDPFTVAVVGLASVGLGLLATLYPSRVAGHLDPVEAIRYE